MRGKVANVRASGRSSAPVACPGRAARGVGGQGSWLAMVAVLGLAGACDAPRALELPPELSHVALVSDEQLSPLLPAADAPAFALESPDDATLIGYPLSALSPLEALIDPAQRLERASEACGALPPPTWAVSTLGEPEAFDTPLTAPWMARACPSDADVAVSCAYRACPDVVPVAGVPCAWTALCNDNLRLTLRPQLWDSTAGCATLGAQAATLTGTWSDDRQRYRAELELSDDRCLVDLRPTPPPPTEIAAEDILQLATPLPSALERPLSNPENPVLTAEGTRGGYITGMLLDLGQRRAIFAVTATACGTPVGTQVRGRLHVAELGARPLVSTQGVATPGCLSALRRLSPESDPLRMVGFTVERRPSGAVARLSVHEYGANLRSVVSRRVGTTFTRAVVADVLLHAGRLFVLTTQSIGATPAAVLHTLDPITLATTATLSTTSTLTMGAAIALEPAPDGAVKVQLRDRPASCVVAPTLDRVDCATSCPVRGSTLVVGVVKFTAQARARDGRLVLGASDAAAGWWLCGQQVRLEARPAPTVVGALVNERDGRMLSSVSERVDGAWRARLVELDPLTGQLADGSWRLPGLLATQLELDDAGNVWILMPWDGRVVRLRRLR